MLDLAGYSVATLHFELDANSGSEAIYVDNVVIAGSPNDNPERSTVDDKNPDPELRSRELIGLELFTGFRFDGDDRWVDGTIYDPNSGKTYRCIITIRDRNTLRVRGYIGFSLLGRTETWTRRIEADDSGEPD